MACENARKENDMRLLMLVTFPTARFNHLWRSGQVGPKIREILEDLKPQAAYFGRQTGGQRGAVLVVDVASEADYVRFTEPWLLAFDAQIETSVCMTAEDIGKVDYDALTKKYG